MYTPRKPASTNQLILMLIIGGFFMTSQTFLCSKGRYYSGESLIEKEIIVSKVPELFRPSKGVHRYSIQSFSYPCHFWISEGSFSIVSKDSSLKKRVKEIGIKDTLLVKIQKKDENILDDKDANPRLIQLIYKNKPIFLAEDVIQADKEAYKSSFEVPLLFLFFGFILLCLKRLGKDFFS
jgi:hypothetical protein